MAATGMCECVIQAVLTAVILAFSFSRYVYAGDLLTYEIPGENTCGSIIESGDQFKLVTSLNEENTYPPNLDCSITFRGKENQGMYIFMIDFNLEMSKNCKNDTLFLYGEGNPRDNILVENDYGVCGRTKSLPNYYVTSSNEVTIRFVTNARNQETYRGFTLMITPFNKVPGAAYCDGHRCGSDKCFTADAYCNGNYQCKDGSDEPPQCKQPSKPTKVNTTEAETEKTEKDKDAFTIMDGSQEYGQTGIRVMRMRKENDVTYMKEVFVDISLKVSNNDTGETRTMNALFALKDRVHALAKQTGLQSPEQFGQEICSTFITELSRVLHCAVTVTEVPWTRMASHAYEANHAFVTNPQGRRFAEVYQDRDEGLKIVSGLKKLRILRTDSDQVMSADVSLKWLLSESADYNDLWESIKNTTMVVFSTPRPETQRPQHSAETVVQQILDDFTEITYAEIEFQTNRYSLVDIEETGVDNNNEIYELLNSPTRTFKASLNRVDEDD